MSNWQALAAAVKSRRSELRISQTELARESGISDQTIRNIEQAARTTYRNATFASIEQALRWPRGTAESVLAGTASEVDVHPPADQPDLVNEATTAIVIPCGTGRHVVTVRGKVIRVDHFS